MGMLRETSTVGGPSDQFPWENRLYQEMCENIYMLPSGKKYDYILLIFQEFEVKVKSKLIDGFDRESLKKE